MEHHDQFEASTEQAEQYPGLPWSNSPWRRWRFSSGSVWSVGCGRVGGCRLWHVMNMGRETCHIRMYIYPRLRNPGNSSGLREYPGYSSTSWEYTVYSRNTPGIPVFGGRTLFRSVFNYLPGNHHLRIPTEWRGTIPDRLGWWNPDESKVVLMFFDSFFPFFSGKIGKCKIATSKPCRSREIPHANPWKKRNTP